MSLKTPSNDALAPSALPEAKADGRSSGANVGISSSHSERKPIGKLESTTGASPQPRDTRATESALLSKALRFAANATPLQLGGIGVGVSAVLYMILGRPGLLLIGAVGGVLAFISWEARNPDVARAVRGESGLDILERLQLEKRNIKANPDDIRPDNDEQLTLKGLDEFRPETREALGGLIDAIIKNYVKWWYSPIVPNDLSFPLACRKTVTSYFLAISNHLYRKRPADAFLDLLTNSSSMVIVFMSELAAAFADLPPDSNISAVDALYVYRGENPDCHLNNLLNREQQNARFRNVAEDLLGFLDSNAHNCDAARVFLREIIANSVLENVLQACSKPEWINGWIVNLLEDGEPDLNQAIDVGMQTNTFADMDGNVGNIGIAKPTRSSTDLERGRPKVSHKKKLSRADEEMEVAVDEMKKINAMMQADDRRRERASTIRNSSEQSGSVHGKNGSLDKTLSPVESSPNSKSSTSRSDAAATPVTPRSTTDATSQGSSPTRSGGSQFTSFDQIQPNIPKADEEAPVKKAPLTLHNASFTLHDDATADNSKIRSKPNWDYLIQVEPNSTHYPGWMIVRRYSDFETLHEIIRRIAAVSGATAFTELHKELPSWKIHTRESLRGELERYLRDACWYLSLAESEGMKRFLEKSQGHTHGESKTFDWETVGKNMLDVLSVAPKGAMEGGKTLVGGVQGVFGNFPGLSRKSTNQSVESPTTNAARLSISTPPRMESRSPGPRSDRASIDSQRSSIVSQQPGKIAPMERRPSYQSQQGDEGDYFRTGRTERLDSNASGPGSARPSREHSRASSLAPIRSPSSVSLDNMKLPPHPDEIPDDHEYPGIGNSTHMRSDSMMGSHSMPSPATISPGAGPALSGKRNPKTPKQYSALSEPETRVAVELLFAVINEMYTLSSAWNIRRTLLTAAKSFLLRPGNPSLLTVQNLIQTTVLDTHTSDAGIAAQLRKIRENSMPTEQERAAWPEPMTDEEKENLRVKARAMLIRSGVPAALMGVMGQAATSEALGRVFDCLQIEEVARGLVFRILLQLVRVVTH